VRTECDGESRLTCKPSAIFTQPHANALAFSGRDEFYASVYKGALPPVSLDVPRTESPFQKRATSFHVEQMGYPEKRDGKLARDR
jgi:hypothetical protein